MTFSLMKSRRSSGISARAAHHDGPIGHHSEHSHAEAHKAKPLPFMASPVDPEALKWVRNKKMSGEGKVVRAKTVAQFEAEAQTESALAHRIFRKQHEASTLELFFDLFFVANLAIFTARSSHTDWQSLSNYVGFFSILWCTWFHISMYDVRFYVDSIFTRITKFLAFGIMVSFVGFASLYFAILTNGQSRAFRGLSLVLFGSRLLLAVQHATVLWYVREFDKVLLPLCLTMVVYILSGFGFFSTFLQTSGKSAISGAAGAPYVRVWYGVIAGETILIIIISCIWRILSFKHTHLVERVGLLTLIVLGEGIIGIVKSTSYSVQGTQIGAIQETGIVVAAVLIIYLLYILYFDNVDHHRFGTIGQQIWTLLHWPLHVSILLTVEGSTALIIWNTCRMAVIWLVNNSLPSMTDPTRAAGVTFKSTADLVTSLNNTWIATRDRYYYKDLIDYYNITSDLSKLSATKAAFGTPEWKAEVTPTLKKASGYLQYFIYQNFGAEGPYDKLKKEKDYSKDVLLYEEGYRFTTCYFYVAAGVLCFVLAFLYWFGRQTKTRTEWLSIGVRILGGMCLPMGIIGPLQETPGLQVGFRYRYSYLIIPIVAFGFLLVLVVDNLVKAISDRSERHSEAGLNRSAMMPLNGDMELTTSETSYDLHRKRSGASRGGNLHGIPEMVDHDDGAALVDNAQKPGLKIGATSGYSELEQDDQEDDLPQYRDQTMQQSRFSSMRKH